MAHHQDDHAHHQDEHAYLGDDFAPNILWFSCGNDPCDSGLIVILDTTWPIAYCLCWSWWWLQLFCDCHVAMILARVAWLWFWLQLGLLPTNKMDQTSQTRPTQNRKRKKWENGTQNVDRSGHAYTSHIKLKIRNVKTKNKKHRPTARWIRSGHQPTN